MEIIDFLEKCQLGVSGDCIDNSVTIEHTGNF